jgi:hypothetical protein
MSFLIWFLQALAIFYMLLFVHGIVQRLMRMSRFAR